MPIAKIGFGATTAGVWDGPKTGADFQFANQVKTEYQSAYFRKKLFWAQFGFKGTAGLMKAPGHTVTFPIFGKMGAAEKPGEDDRLAIDKFGDSYFTATVREVAKAFGITDAAKVGIGSGPGAWLSEGLRQQARRMAEEVDKDALAVIESDTGGDIIRSVKDITITGTHASTNDGRDDAKFQAMLCSPTRVREDHTNSFGDRKNEVVAQVFHSQNLMSLETDKDSGFLKADAKSHWQLLDGFKGMLFERPAFELDNTVQSKNTSATHAKGKISVTDSASAKKYYEAWANVYMKKNPFAHVLKKLFQLESARDILGRQDIYSSTGWYGFTTLHKRNTADDIRLTKGEYVTKKQTVA